MHSIINTILTTPKYLLIVVIIDTVLTFGFGLVIGHKYGYDRGLNDLQAVVKAH